MKKSASAVADDEYFVQQIRQAVAWSAHLRIGPHQKFTERFEGGDKADEAFAAAERLTREHSRYGRRGIVYAINARGDSIPVDAELLALARQGV